ncbi:MAG: TonB-dependent receptor, partial [Silanimonas sp.]
ALQRVTGVQITRVFGEGQSVSIRGLPQVRVEVDGRTLLGWSAKLSPPENEQLGRSSGLDTVPGGLFGRLEVRKSPTAKQVEGGLGGSVNLVTPDPLDYDKPVFFARLQGTYSDVSDTTEPAFSAMVTQKLNDRVGVLVAIDATERTSTIQAFERNNFFTTAGRDLNGDGTADVSGDRLHYEQFTTDRSRLGATVELEVRPTDALTVKGELIYSEMETAREQDFLAWRYAGRAVTNPVFDGNFIVAGRSTGTLQQAGLYRAEPTESLLGALSVDWQEGAWGISADLSYSEGTLDQVIRQITLDSINRNVVGDFDYRGGAMPSLVFVGFDAANPANYRASQVRANRLIGDLDELAAKLDISYYPESTLVTGLHAGIRSRTLTSFVEARRSQLVPTATEIAPFITVTDPSAFLPDIGGTFPRGFVTSVIAPDWVLQRVGGNPLDPNAARDYDLTEDSTALYVMADLEGSLGEMPWRANAGLRWVDTDLEVDTFLEVTGGRLVPVRDTNAYDVWLPSANIAFNVTSDFLVRFAASRTMQQAGIRELAPSIFVNLTNRTATGGNAGLRPTLSDQADVSAEYYFSEDGLLSGALFYKDVTDFIANETVLQTFPGFESLGPIPFTRPDNIGAATVKGFEVGYQDFFDGLPAPFDGLGLIANYTFSDAEDDQGNPLVGVSKNSLNISLLYEKGALSTRLAYNRRDEAAFSFTEGRPDFVDGIAQLDFQIGWKFNSRWSMQFQAANLVPEDSAAVEYSQIGPVALNSYALSERRFSLSLRGRF